MRAANWGLLMPLGCPALLTSSMCMCISPIPHYLMHRSMPCVQAPLPPRSLCIDISLAAFSLALSERTRVCGLGVESMTRAYASTINGQRSSHFNTVQCTYSQNSIAALRFEVVLCSVCKVCCSLRWRTQHITILYNQDEESIAAFGGTRFVLLGGGARRQCHSSLSRHGGLDYSQGRYR